jgi:hypothetical protein
MPTNARSSLFLALSIVLFIIVRRKRRRTAIEEAEKNRRIDDDIGDVELVITKPNSGPMYPKQTYQSHGHRDEEWEGGMGEGDKLDNPFEDVRYGHASREVSPGKA